MTLEEIEKAKRARLEGYTWVEIGRVLGRPESQVKYYVKKVEKEPIESWWRNTPPSAEELTIQRNNLATELAHYKKAAESNEKDTKIAKLSEEVHKLKETLDGRDKYKPYTSAFGSMETTRNEVKKCLATSLVQALPTQRAKEGWQFYYRSNLEYLRDLSEVWLDATDYSFVGNNMPSKEEAQQHYDKVNSVISRLEKALTEK